MDDEARRPSRRKDEEEEGGSGIPPAAWIGGGVVGVLGLGAYFVFRPAKKVAPPVDVVRKDAEEKKSDDPAIQPKTKEVPFQIPPNKDISPKDVFNPNKDPFKPVKDAGTGVVPPQPQTDPEQQRALAAGWSVPADPSDQKWDFPEQPLKFALPMGQSTTFHLPTSPSPVPHPADGHCLVGTGVPPVFASLPQIVAPIFPQVHLANSAAFDVYPPLSARAGRAIYGPRGLPR